MIDKAERLLLTTSAAAELLGVHPSTVKRWSDDGTIPSRKTEGGHRRIHLTDILKVARDRASPTFLDPFSPWESNVWFAVSAAAGPEGFERLIGLALGWLARGETDLLGRLFFEVGRREEISFTRFLDEGIRGFMARVGEEWRKGRLQVGEEHMATQVVLEALLRLRMSRESASLPPPGPVEPKPVAIVGSMEGDYHDLGAQAIRSVLEREGWKVYYLGPNVPVEEFANVQQAQVADLVCVSFSANNTLPDLQRATKVLGQFYRPRTPYALALGGPFRDVSAGEIGEGPFEDLSFSTSAMEFHAWLQSHFRRMPPGEPRRVA
jgi:excisionase family DNA binding protein